MVFKSSLVLLSVLSMLSFSGCSSDDSTSSGGSSGTGGAGGSGDQTALEGTWTDSESILKFAGHTFDVAFMNSEDNVTIDVKMTGTFTEDGYKIVQPNDKNTTKVKITTKTCSVKTKTSSQAMVVAWNGASFCGSDDWTINTAKEVSTCPNFTEICYDDLNTEDKMIYFIENNTKLYFGDDDQIGTDGYPDALNTDYSTKQ